MLHSLDSWSSKLNSLYARASLVAAKDTEVSRTLDCYQQLYSHEVICYHKYGALFCWGSVEDCFW